MRRQIDRPCDGRSLSRAGQSDSLEYFAWRALELRQCHIADELQILTPDGVV